MKLLGLGGHSWEIHIHIIRIQVSRDQVQESCKLYTARNSGNSNVGYWNNHLMDMQSSLIYLTAILRKPMVLIAELETQKNFDQHLYYLYIETNFVSFHLKECMSSSSHELFLINMLLFPYIRSLLWCFFRKASLNYSQKIADDHAPSKPPLQIPIARDLILIDSYKSFSPKMFI